MNPPVWSLPRQNPVANKEPNLIQQLHSPYQNCLLRISWEIFKVH
uniref:Uncharacterized protein n=1 Tax=Anguilla anguilla TaxID=7936 RepID=A0A0E9TH75_ANGAN